MTRDPLLDYPDEDEDEYAPGCLGILVATLATSIAFGVVALLAWLLFR